MDEPQPRAERDARGRLLPGHKPLTRPKKKQPDEPLEPHPRLSGRDAKGRLLPGHNMGGTGHIPAIRAEFVQAIHQANTAQMVVGVLEEVRQLALTSENQYVKLAAAQEYLNRLIGKTPKEVSIDKQVTNTNVTVDYNRLTDQELELMETLLSKAQPAPVVIDVDVETIPLLEHKQ